LVEAQDPDRIQTRLEIPGYHLLDKIGEGGMGEVHRATQLSLQRAVAIKFLYQRGGESGALSAFQRESRLMAALTHPHVVTIYDCGEACGRHYLVMEYVDGSTLRSRIEPARPMPVAEAARVLDAIARALSYIHEQDILHLDLKPENVLCTPAGAIKITDFGLASPHGGARLQPELERCQGTVDYCSPEQRHGLPLDKRSDVFALAVLAYELLTGHLPSRVYVPASERNPRLPRAVNDVLYRGLARDPDERYRTVEEFREGLVRSLGMARRRAWPWPALAAAVALLLGWLWAVGGSQPQTDAVADPRPEVTWLRPAPFDAQSELLYSSNQIGNSNIFLLRPDGRAPTQLTHDEGRSIFPTWSPDGKKIAFVSDRAGPQHIYVMDSDGRNVKQLTNGQNHNRVPGWSPDGRRLAFNSNRDGPWEIYVMEADGSGQTRLTGEGEFSGDPAWSPDGKKIAFTSKRGPQKGMRLLVMDADGKNVRTLSTTDNSFGFVYPAWSPDGKQIAYGDQAGSAAEIFICDAQGTRPRQLTRLGGVNSLAAWSPDGARIAFQHASAAEEHGTLYIVNAGGGDPRVILKAAGPQDGGRPSWKPR
jgi:serine/threonine protein kinase